MINNLEQGKHSKLSCFDPREMVEEGEGIINHVILGVCVDCAIDHKSKP